MLLIFYNKSYSLGAYCTHCTITKKEGADLEKAKNGFPKDRNRDQNRQLYDSLKKNPDGTINKRVESIKRKGMTAAPLGTFLDWTSKYLYIY